MKPTRLQSNPFVSRNSIVLPTLALISLSGGPLMAADSIWGGAGSTTTTGDYSTATNWSGGTIPAGTSNTDLRAVFNGVNGSAATAITVNANRTARFLFTGSTSYTLSGGSFTASSGSEMINLDSSNAANQTVNSDMYFGSAAGQINIIRNSSTGNRTLNMGGNIGGQTAGAGFTNSLQVNSGTGNTVVMSGNISNTLAGKTDNGGLFNLQKIGGSTQSGNLTLNGNNTYSGGTDYFAGSGSFTLGHKNALGTGDLRLNGSGVIISANTALTGANAIGNTLRFNGALASVGGSTSVTPTASGSFTATLSDATNLAVGQVINYQAVARNYAIGTYITAISGTTITLSTPALSATAISSGTARFQAYGGGSGTTTFDGSNAIEFSGTTYLGSERATSGTATQTFSVTNTGGVTFSGQLTEQNSIINGALVQGALTKTGAGTLILSGNTNNYTGNTQVSNGTLLASNTSGSATGTGTVAVKSGATLGGGSGATGGRITGATVIENGGFQTAGTRATATPAIIGIQTFDTGGIDYQAGSIFEWNLTASGVSEGTRGTNYDGVSASSFSNTGANAIFRVVLNGTQDFTSGFWDADKSWTNIFTNIAGASQSLEDVFGNAVQTYNSAGILSDISAQGSFTISGTDLNWTAVPEPTSAFAGLLLGAGLLRRKRQAVRG